MKIIYFKMCFRRSAVFYTRPIHIGLLHATKRLATRLYSYDSAWYLFENISFQNIYGNHLVGISEVGKSYRVRSSHGTEILIVKSLESNAVIGTPRSQNWSFHGGPVKKKRQVNRFDFGLWKSGTSATKLRFDLYVSLPSNTIFFIVLIIFVKNYLHFWFSKQCF